MCQGEGFVVFFLNKDEMGVGGESREEAKERQCLVKNLPASAGDVRDPGLIPILGTTPGEEHGNLLQYSCLENPMDRGAWRATVHGVAKSQTRLRRQHAHSGVGKKLEKKWRKERMPADEQLPEAGGDQ